MCGSVWTCCVNDSRTDLCSYFSYKSGPGVHGKYPGLHQLKLEDMCICESTLDGIPEFKKYLGPATIMKIDIIGIDKLVF